MLDAKGRQLVGAAASLLLIGVVGACGPDDSSTPPPPADGQNDSQSSATDDETTTGESTDDGSSEDGGSSPSDKIVDCATGLEGTSVAMGVTIICDGWTVQVTDFQQNAPPPDGVELQNPNTGQAIDSSTSLASATIEVSTIGDGTATSYTDFVWNLLVGDLGDDSAQNTEPLIEVAVGSDTPGQVPEPLPISCLVEADAPCTGTVYFEIDDIDLSADDVYVELDSPTDNSMGAVQVK